MAPAAERCQQGAPPLPLRLWGCCVTPAVQEPADACGAAAVLLPPAGKAAAAAAAAPAQKPQPPPPAWAVAWRRPAARQQHVPPASAATKPPPAAAAVTASSASLAATKAQHTAADVAAPRAPASQHSSELLVAQLVVPACSSSGGASCQHSADTAVSSSSMPRTPEGLVLPQLSRTKLLLLQSGVPASANASFNSAVPPEPLSTSRSASCSCQATVSSTVGSSIVAPASSSTAALASLAEVAAAVEAAATAAAPAAGNAAGAPSPPPQLPAVPELQLQTAVSMQAAAAPSSAGGSDRATAQAEGAAAAPAVQLALRLPRTSSSNTPFAQLAFQQAVACDLLAEPQQQLEQQQQGSAAVQPGSASVLPLLSSGAGLGGGIIASTTASAQLAPTPSGAAAAARAAAAAAAAASGSPFTVGPPVATRSSSRVSWGASSVAVLENDVFGVLDPETESVSSGRILQRSASSSSLTGGGAGSSSSGSSDAPPDKLQTLRSMLLGGQPGGAVGAAGSSRLKGVLRRSTHVASNGSSNGPTQAASGGSRDWQRSKSAHGLAELQQPAAGAAAGAARGLRASTSFAGHSSSSLPPLPPSALLLPGTVSCPLPPGGHVGGGALVAGGSSGASSIGSRSTALQERPGSSAAGARSSASLAGSASSGSLVALAVNRMHSAPAPAGAESNSSSSATSSVDGRRPLPQSRSTGALSGLASAAADGCDVARGFADAFLAALAAGDTKWASDLRVSGLLHEAARMVGLDRQVYDGRTAIIRRLNGGMEQLVKTVAAHAPDGATGGAAAPAGAVDGAAKGAAAWGRLPPPGLAVTCADAKRRPGHVTAVYSFRLGLRKFTLRDEFIVKSGQILRLRRTRG